MILHIVSTPIGNYEDITLRALRILKTADLILCEDTRVSSKLLLKFDIKKRLSIYNDYSNSNQRKKIISLMKEEKKSIALISDSGTPLISDPGYKLVRECIEEKIKVTTIPGACSIISALSISGISTDNFLFNGFIDKSKKQKIERFKTLSNIDNTTLIFFETANRLLNSLKDLYDIFGNREIAVIRELTKIYEENQKGQIKDIIKFYEDKKVKGEIIIIISPSEAKRKSTEELDKIDCEIEKGLQNNIKPKELIELLSYNYKISKKILYKKIINFQRDR